MFIGDKNFHFKLVQRLVAASNSMYWVISLIVSSMSCNRIMSQCVPLLSDTKSFVGTAGLIEKQLIVLY